MTFGLNLRKKDVVNAQETEVSADSSSDKTHGKSSAVEKSASEAEKDLQSFKIAHEFDPNLPIEDLAIVNAALKTHDPEKEIAVDQSIIESEDSPYPEVRAAVRNYDEDVPANTVRAWVIGMLWTTIGSGVNMLFSMRSPSVYLTPVVTLLLSYPFGLAWAAWMPKRKFKTPWGNTWSLNFDGPFNMKEHTLIVIMANASFGGTTAYSTDVLLAQQVNYGQSFGWGYQLLLTITCQLLGFGMAGLTRKWLVEPAAMIWPSNLVTTTMFETIHTRSSPDRVHSGSSWKIGRYKWFLALMAVVFVYEWFPLWIAPVLATFTFASWIAPNNVVVNQVFGGVSGISLIPLTFDWATITGYITSPLIYPFHALANTTIGLIIFFMIITPAIHFSGIWYGAYLPMSTSGSFDNTGAAYNVSRILTPEYTLDPALYAQYSPLFLSTTFALCYGLSFATIISLVVHTILYDRKTIWQRWKEARGDGADCHQKMMMKYTEAKGWWYGASFIIMLALGFTTCLVWETHLSWWAFIVALFISLFFYLPVGIIQATTNVQLGLNVITEFIIGYMQPGKPLAMMMFKMYGYITVYQGLYFTQDIKLAHYMKVPQRTTFWAQLIATVWSCIVQIAVMNWALGSIPDICSTDQPDNYTCPSARVFFTASIIWGVIGPNRIFGSEGLYHPMLYFFLIGLLVPIPIYLLAKKYPTSFWRYVSTPIIFGGTANIPPATVMIYASWAFVGTMFNKVIKGRAPGWWAEYNYITSAALDSGTFICILLIFFALQLPNKVSAPQWWGGSGGGYTLNADWNATPQLVLTEGHFGPSTWS